MEENIKESFQKVKLDIFSLKKELAENNSKLTEICEILESMNLSYIDKITKLNKEILILQNSLDSIKNSLNKPIPTNTPNFPTDSRVNPTDKELFKPLKEENTSFSMRNEGVPTDKQTNQQTNQQTQNNPEIFKNSINNASEILDSLDSLKKEIRLKFKKLTDQELMVFSLVYQLEDEKGYSDYKTLSERLNLSESSIRDYVGKLIKKGIPIEKIKINNKSVQLKISENLKKIASLATILQLKDL